jgi:carboxyl-terminal processing protease
MVFSKAHIQAIEKNKEEIMNAIELELISRYQYQSGKIKLALQKDKDVKEAISLLRNTRKMKEILDGKL